MLNVFHISDLHFTADREGLRRDYSYAAANAILQLAKNLKAQGVLGSSLAVMITGDLVQSGTKNPANNVSDFDAVQREFLGPLLQILGVEPSRVFIVPGNHEMMMGAINVDSYQSFYSSCSEASLCEDLRVKLSNYLSFVEDNGYQSVSSDDPRIAIFSVDGQQIVCINGLAGSYSRQGFGDKGELFVLQTEYAGKFSKIEDFAIVLMHHPLSWYSDECEVTLREFFGKKRCRLLTGHIHNDAISEISTSRGSMVTIQAGASAETGDIRFSVALAWFPKSNSAAVRLYKYDEREASFPITKIDETRVAPNQASGFFEKSEAFFDPKMLGSIAVKAKDQSSNQLQELAGYEPARFTPPDLMIYSEDHFSGKKTKIDDLVRQNSNVIISGYELSGKSSLLCYACYQFNNVRTCDYDGVGIYVDFRELQKSDNISSLLLRRITELNVSEKQAEYLFEVGKIRIFLDNFDANDDRSIGRFLSFCQQYPKIGWTAVARGSESFMPSQAPSALDGTDTSYYQLSEVTLPTVLKMIEGHDSCGNAEKPRAVVQRVFQSIQNLSAPRTMFYVRSMLDIFLSDASVEPLNRYLLIENLISDRMRKAHREIFPGLPVDMQMLDSFIGLLAYHLLKKEISFVSKAEFLTLAEDFVDRKGLQRKRFDPEKILNTLILSRILRAYESGFGFLILSIEDYFLAKHMVHDEAFRSSVLSPNGILMLPAVAEYYVAQNPNDRPRIDSIFAIIDEFRGQVDAFVVEIEDDALDAIRTAAPGTGCRIQDQLLDSIAAIDSADEPSMIQIAEPVPVGKTTRVRYSVEEQGAVLLQLGASILGVTRTLDQVDRVAIFQRLRELLLICVKGIPLVAQHLADGHEVRFRGTSVKAEYRGHLSVQEDRFYIILRGMIHALLKQFSTWAGSPSFFESAVKLRQEETNEIISAALFAQNIEADLAEALNYVPDVSGKIDSMVLKEVITRLYLDAMTLVPLERGDESRGINVLVDLASEVYPSAHNSKPDQMKRHKDGLRRKYSEVIGINTYVGRRMLSSKVQN